MAVTSVDSKSQYDSLLSGHNGLVVANFWASWAASCQQMNDVSEQLSKRYPHVLFLSVEAEKIFEVSEAYEIDSVPTILLLKGGSVAERLTGADVPGFSEKVAALAGPRPAGAAPVEDLNTRLQGKGDVAEPKCGFSRKAVALLQEQSIQFTTFDILSDEDVRQGLKTFSDWPTYPQLYAQGKLVGGLDIMQELAEGEELKDTLMGEINARLQQLITESPVVLFMKGDPEEPKCGFSRKAVALLQENDVPFGTFDILSDEDVRQGLKTFSNWPTYPQLYAQGKLVGGLDIMQELAEEDELKEALGV